MTTDDITTMNLKIEGHVQGVGFRDYAVRVADAQKLQGWVRNLSDGRLEVMVSGPTPQVETFIGACVQGPPGARVENIDLMPAEPPNHAGFLRLPDA